MSKLVCDTSNNECMVHRCAKCPGYVNLKAFLDEELIEIDEEEEIQFNQWQSTDRSQLITQTVNLFEYKELVVSHIYQLTSHSYIAKCQTRNLKELKNNLGIQADFAENYQFVIQDEIQSYH